MKKVLIWLTLCLPCFAFACSLEQQTEWQRAAESAVTRGDPANSLNYYQRLADCQPLRGDLRVELLRNYLALDQMDKARQQRKWLVEHNAPSGLIQLADTWILRASDQKNELSHAATPIQHTRFTLGTAYSSNANEVTSESSIPVEIDGIPMRLEVTDRPQPSNIHSLQLEYQRRSASRDLYFGGQFQHYSRLNESEHRLMGGMIQRHNCLAHQHCDFSVHLHHQSRDNNHQQQLQLGTAIRKQPNTYGLYYRFLNSSTETDAHTMGLDWRFIKPPFQFHSAIEHDYASSFRPGGNRTRVLISASLHSTRFTGLSGQISYQREYDQTAYAPIFWGEQKRNRNMIRGRIEHSYALSNNWFIQNDLVWQDTRSDLPLFSHRGWSTGIKLHKLF